MHEIWEITFADQNGSYWARKKILDKENFTISAYADLCKIFDKKWFSNDGKFEIVDKSEINALNNFIRKEKLKKLLR